MDTAPTTILSALIAAVVGGGLGAFISARSNITLAREARRDRARAALWEYHRTLSGFSTKLFSDTGAGEEVAFIGTAEFGAVKEAYKTAYPWAGYLKPDVREKLFHQAYIDIGEPPYDDARAAVAVERLATALRGDLEHVFPLK